MKCLDGFDPSAIRGDDRFRRIADVAALRGDYENCVAERSTRSDHLANARAVVALIWRSVDGRNSTLTTIPKRLYFRHRNPTKRKKKSNRFEINFVVIQISSSYGI